MRDSVWACGVWDVCGWMDGWRGRGTGNLGGRIGVGRVFCFWWGGGGGSLRSILIMLGVR